MATLLRARRFTVDEYHRMGEAGILSASDRVELIDGEIIEMAPIGVRHARQVTRIATRLTTLIGDRAVVSVQNPVRLSEISEPQPDISVLRPGPDLFRETHPGPSDILLVIEVGDASANLDRRVKLPLYARAGVAEVWLGDLQANRIDVYREPIEDRYTSAAPLEGSDQMAVPGFPDVRLTRDDLLS
jgi:Uma2 family endonuclease